jgi:hypothetical protein
MCSTIIKIGSALLFLVFCVVSPLIISHLALIKWKINFYDKSWKLLLEPLFAMPRCIYMQNGRHMCSPRGCKFQVCEILNHVFLDGAIILVIWGPRVRCMCVCAMCHFDVRQNNTTLPCAINGFSVC